MKKKQEEFGQQYLKCVNQDLEKVDIVWKTTPAVMEGRVVFLLQMDHEH